jgi:hypothetical protein
MLQRRSAQSVPVAPAGWRSGCPVCGHHDKVRQLDAVYQDRERTIAEHPPLVNRFGLLVRGHPMLRSVPRVVTRVKPPRRPSALVTHLNTSGVQVGALVGVPFGIALLARPGTVVDCALSLVVALVLGILSEPLLARGRVALARQTAEWEQAMRTWRTLRYCSRCDQVFSARG